MNLNEHYALLLGLTSDWKVDRVCLEIAQNRVDIYLSYIGKTGVCPDCGSNCHFHDHAPERTWRHLDTMQFATVLHAAPPRIRCDKHGVKTLPVPWAGKNSRFTLMFEAFAIVVLQASKSIKDAMGILRLNWESAQTIMKRAVGRGLSRRGKGEIPWVGLDEKSFGKGHDYITVLVDLEEDRVLDVEPGRCGASAKAVIDRAMTDSQKEMVCGVAMDMSAPYETASRSRFPHADIVFDKFHVSKLLCDAVDKVRRQENARLLRNGDRRLVRTRYLWLAGLEHLSDENRRQLDGLLRQSLQVSKAWKMKDLFEGFWTRRDKDFARDFFAFWYKHAIGQNLRPLTQAAETLKRHLYGLLNYYESFLTNAATEGLNSKIQFIKNCARGFRNADNYRTSILFFCGKLDMAPALPSH